jgi:PiT family inorganic phosphate transporter
MLPQLTMRSGTAAQCRPGNANTLRLTTDGLHRLSSGAVGAARGLNDAPKIVAVAGVLLGTAVAPGVVLALVAAAMFVGSLAAGLRVAKVMAEGSVRMDAREGLQANLASALLVAVGANAGLPMSTTHVATGAIAGIAGRRGGRLHGGTLRNLALAWTLTPATSALLAWTTVRLLGAAGLR